MPVGATLTSGQPWDQEEDTARESNYRLASLETRGRTWGCRQKGGKALHAPELLQPQAQQLVQRVALLLLQGGQLVGNLRARATEV